MGRVKGRWAAAVGLGMLALGGVRAEARCLLTGEDFTVGAKAAVVMEAQTGELLFAQDPHEELPMASTTKIMTALLTLEQPGLDEEFTVDPMAIRVEGSSMGLREGDTVTLRALAGGMLTASGNDAAGAAAVRIAGSLEEFAALMNRRAGELGMEDTHFVTPSGLDAEGHRSSAYDMALLCREALRNPDFAEMAAARSLTLRYGDPPYDRTLQNHNRLLSLYPGAIGVKTGYTKAAGRCLVSAARRDGVTLICVTLGCPDDWNVHAALYDRYFPRVEAVPLVPEEDLSLPVVGGSRDSVPLRQEEDLTLARAQGLESRVEAKIFAPKFLYAPIFDGDIVGKIVYYRDGTPVGESPLAAGGTVPALPPPEKGFWEELLSRW